MKKKHEKVGPKQLWDGVEEGAVLRAMDGVGLGHVLGYPREEAGEEAVGWLERGGAIR